MTQTKKAKIFMSGRSQAVRIPAEFRFRTSEVSIRRDPASGDIVLSQGPGTWAEVFAALDQAQVPEDFLSDAERDRRFPEERRSLEEVFNTATARAELK